MKTNKKLNKKIKLENNNNSHKKVSKTNSKYLDYKDEGVVMRKNIFTDNKCILKENKELVIGSTYADSSLVHVYKMSYHALKSAHDKIFASLLVSKRDNYSKCLEAYKRITYFKMKSSLNGTKSSSTKYLYDVPNNYDDFKKIKDKISDISLKTRNLVLLNRETILLRSAAILYYLASFSKSSSEINYQLELCIQEGRVCNFTEINELIVTDVNNLRAAENDEEIIEKFRTVDYKYFEFIATAMLHSEKTGFHSKYMDHHSSEECNYKTSTLHYYNNNVEIKTGIPMLNYAKNELLKKMNSYGSKIYQKAYNEQPTSNLILEDKKLAIGDLTVEQIGHLVKNMKKETYKKQNYTLSLMKLMLNSYNSDGNDGNGIPESFLNNIKTLSGLKEMRPKEDKSKVAQSNLRTPVTYPRVQHLPEMCDLSIVIPHIQRSKTEVTLPSLDGGIYIKGWDGHTFTSWDGLLQKYSNKKINITDLKGGDNNNNNNNNTNNTTTTTTTTTTTNK